MGCTEKTPDDTSTQDTDTDTDTAPTEAPWNNICEGVPGDDHGTTIQRLLYFDFRKVISDDGVLHSNSSGFRVRINEGGILRLWSWPVIFLLRPLR